MSFITRKTERKRRMSHSFKRENISLASVKDEIVFTENISAGTYYTIR